MLDRSAQVTATKDAAIYNGCEFSRAEIEITVNELAERVNLLKANVDTLNVNFTLRRMVEIKLAAENAASVAGDAKRTAAQIEALSASLAQVFFSHINRRSRL